MRADPDPRYQALRARDSRFDGRFFVGVSSTGIYCRPVCTARTPKRENCRFFPSAAAAEAAGYRPCLRCRPELAPGNASVDARARIAHAAADLIEDGLLNDVRVDELATRLGVTDRHLRRVFQSEYGVSPIQYAQTQRLLMAKRLLTDTSLPVIEDRHGERFRQLAAVQRALPRPLSAQPDGVAEASRSERDRGRSDAPARLPAAVRLGRARRVPRAASRRRRGARTRRRVPADRPREADGDGRARLDRGPPGARAGGARRDGRRRAPESASPGPRAGQAALRPLLPPDGDRRPRSAGWPRPNPGLRVPGAFDGFELAVRAVLGQQVTVKGARTLAGRFARAFGEPAVTPFPGLDVVFPTPRDRRAARGPGHRRVGDRRGEGQVDHRARDGAGRGHVAAGACARRSKRRSRHCGGPRGSASGRRSTSRCGPCRGPTRFRTRTSASAKRCARRLPPAS